MKKRYWLLLAAAGILVLTIRSPEGPAASTAAPLAEVAPPAVAKPDLELLDFEGRATAIGGEITGSIRNNDRKKYGYVQVTFTLLDDAGDQVGSAMANVNGLEPGRTWKFKAVAFTSFARMKLDAITGY